MEKLEQKKPEPDVKVEQPETSEQKQPETVKVKLFKDGGKYKSDVFVCVNGKRLQIRRGVEVEIPAEHAEVLANSARQDGKTADLMDQKAAEYEAEVKRLQI